MVCQCRYAEAGYRELERWALASRGAGTVHGSWLYMLVNCELGLLVLKQQQQVHPPAPPQPNRKPP